MRIALRSPKPLESHRMNKYTGIFTRDTEDGGWVAQCAEVPSAITQGETLSEAKKNLQAAIGYMLKVEAKLCKQLEIPSPF